MDGQVCTATNNSATWDSWDVIQWKMPERLGGGIPYIQSFKDAWVRNNKATIISNAATNRMPAELLAGVCWIEVGGDPSFIDGVAFEVRSFDYSGPDWVDRNMTITRRPEMTSFGAVSIQLRVAAETLGLDQANLTTSDYRALATCLSKDVYNIEVVARHLRSLIDHDSLQTRDSSALTMDQVKIVGARYNRGAGLTLAQIQRNTSYGDFIVRIWSRLTGLIR